MKPGRRPASELTRRRSARGAVLNMFFVDGAALGTWLSLIPAVQQKLALHPSELGIALLGLAIGAVVATSSTGWLVGRAGGRRVATLAMTVGCVILFLLPIAPNLRHAVKATRPFSMLLTLTKPADKPSSPNAFMLTGLAALSVAW